MKTLDVVGTGARKVKAAVAAVAAQLRPTPASSSTARDPFYSDSERRAAINAGADAAAGRWVGRRKGWLR